MLSGAPDVVARSRPPVAWALILPAAAAELVLLVATANRYGYHRDELYFRVAGKHPDWAYDDQPALTPLLGRLSEWMFGEDPRGLRMLSAIAIALVVVLVALIARELGAGHAGQAVAALATAASGIAMAVGHLLSTTTFDLLVWVTRRVPRRANSRRRRRSAMAAGRPCRRHRAREQASRVAPARRARLRLPVARRAGLARSPWLWGGAALALVLWMPNLLWQARHGWPQLELARAIGAEDPTGNRVQLLPLQLLLIGPLLAPLWIAGLWWLLRRPAARPFRPLGLAYLTLLAVVFVTGGKPYYTVGLLLPLLGAGAVVAEERLRAGKTTRLRLGVAIGVSAAVAAAITLPLVPVADLLRHRFPPSTKTRSKPSAGPPSPRRWRPP